MAGRGTAVDARQLMAVPAATDRCPRCGAGFHCGVHDAAPCPCTGVRLDPAQLAALRVRFEGCLCLGCLLELAKTGPADPLALPGRPAASRP